MGTLTDYSENKLIDHVFDAAYTPEASLYLALFTDDPTDTGDLTNEADYTGYARKAISFGAGSSRRVTQDALIVFAECTGGSNVITHWAIMDGSTVGADEALAHGSVTSAKTISTGKTPSIASGETYVEFLTGSISDYLAVKLLDLMFNNTSYTQPSIYIGLVKTTEVTDADTGATITELGMIGYDRTQAATGWTVTSSSVVNDGDVDFGTLTSTGEVIVSAVVTDNATVGAGNNLFYDNSLSASIADGDSVKYASGDFSVQMT